MLILFLMGVLLPVLRLDAVEPAKYAVIVVGADDEDPEDMHIPFKTSGDRLYNVLKNKGFTDENIAYLCWIDPTPDPEIPQEQPDPNVDSLSKKNRIRRALTDWLGPNLDNDQDDETVVIYFIDHGNFTNNGGLTRDTYYFLPYDHYGSNFVWDTEMSTWINNALTEGDGSNNFGSATIVVETCYSGILFDPILNLTGPDRVVITATDADHLAYSWWDPPLSWKNARPADSDGEPIFSYYFLKNIDSGLSVQSAFSQAYSQTLTEIARLAMAGEEQYPQMDDQYGPTALYW